MAQQHFPGSPTGAPIDAQKEFAKQELEPFYKNIDFSPILESDKNLFQRKCEEAFRMLYKFKKTMLPEVAPGETLHIQSPIGVGCDFLAFKAIYPEANLAYHCYAPLSYSENEISIDRSKQMFRYYEKEISLHQETTNSKKRLTLVESSPPPNIFIDYFVLQQGTFITPSVLLESIFPEFIAKLAPDAKFILSTNAINHEGRQELDKLLNASALFNKYTYCEGDLGLAYNIIIHFPGPQLFLEKVNTLFGEKWNKGHYEQMLKISKGTLFVPVPGTSNQYMLNMYILSDNQDADNNKELGHYKKFLKEHTSLTNEDYFFRSCQSPTGKPAYRLVFRYSLDAIKHMKESECPEASMSATLPGLKGMYTTSSNT